MRTINRSFPLYFIFRLVLTVIVVGGLVTAKSSARSLSDRSESNHVVLAPGRFADWPAPHGVAITVGSGGVVHASDRGNVVRFIGKKLGQSLVRVGDHEVNINVVNAPTFELYDKLQKVLEGRRGLRVTAEAKSILISGRLLRWQDWLDLADAARSSAPATYSFAATMEPEIRARALGELQKFMHQASLPEITYDFRPQAVALVPSSPADLAKRAADVLSPFGIHIEGSGSALSLEPLVRVKILIAEIKKEQALNYGIKWPSEMNAQLIPSLGLTASETLPLQLQALESTGQAKILASPTILCRSGKEAKFLAGGEIPIKISSHRSNDVIWKEYGVMLKVKPLADFSGRMSIAIETEVSTLEPAPPDTIPGISTTRIETHFDLVKSRTIAISGLLRNDSSQSAGGLPLLGQIPILGPLFSSRNFREKKTELVVFVTPDIVKPEEENL